MRARLIFAFFALCALAFPGLAEDRRGGSSLDRVLPEIRRSVPGTFSDAEGPFLTPDGRATYHVKWMTPDGRIIWFTVDARSGQIMGGAPGQQTRPRYQDNSDWGDRRNNFSNEERWNNNWSGHDDRGHSWGSDRGGGWGNDRGGGGGNNQGGGWGNGQGGGNNQGGDRSNNRGGWGGHDDRSHSWGNGQDHGGWGNDQGRGHNDRDGRGGHDRRHGG